MKMNQLYASEHALARLNQSLRIALQNMEKSGNVSAEDIITALTDPIHEWAHDYIIEIKFKEVGTDWEQ